MKNLVTFVAVLVVGFLSWKFYTERKEKQMAAIAAAQPKSLSAPRPGQAIKVHAVLNDWSTKVFGKIDTAKPEDVVPPLAVTCERLLSARNKVEPQKQPVYDQAIAVANSLIQVGEERTKLLEIRMQSAKNGRSSLDSKGTAVGSKEFFAQSAEKRWSDTTARMKPGITQALTALKTAEENWNSQVAPTAPMDALNIDGLEKVLVTVDASKVSKSSLDRSKYVDTRTNYPWRSVYYQKYGISSIR